MNLSEFKAWFEGVTEDMDGPPNAKQWKRIKKRVAEITSDPTPWPVFVDRYVRPLPAWPPYREWWTTNTGGVSSSNTNLQAFNPVGKAEMKSIN